MIDRVLTLNNGIKYCVLDEYDDNSRKYVIAFELDTNTENITSNYVICEASLGIDKAYYLCNIEDKTIYEKVSNIFIKRLSE